MTNCANCPCPDTCLRRPDFCAWAAEAPPDPVKLRHICARSAMGAAPRRPASSPGPAHAYPPLAKQAGSLSRSLWDWAVSGFSAASEEEQARRLAICEACPLRNAEDRRCWKCGCFTDAKVKLKTEHCPEGKW